VCTNADHEFLIQLRKHKRNSKPLLFPQRMFELMQMGTGLYGGTKEHANALTVRGTQVSCEKCKVNLWLNRDKHFLKRFDIN
jgi:hypothetical protein